MGVVTKNVSKLWLNLYHSDKSNDACEADGEEEGQVILQLHVINLTNYADELISNLRKG